jgi:phage terminase large subunit-like protein
LVDIKKLIKDKASSSFNSRRPELAIPYFLKDNSTGKLVKMAFIHCKWHSHITKNKFSLIIAPRDHGKSEQIAIGRVLFEIGNNPNIRIKLFSGKNELAKKRLKAVINYISKSDDYSAIYPEIKILSKNTASSSGAMTVDRAVNSKEPTLEAYGISASVTGDRADLIICDDICTFENTIAKPKAREIVKEKFYNDIMNLLEPEGRLIYISTLWHKDDLSHDLMRNREDNGFALLFQAIPDDLTPLWKEKWTREALLKRRATNPRAFDRGFRNIALTDDEALFPRDVISRCIYIGKPQEHVDQKFQRFVGVDLAIGKGRSNDYTVIFVIAVNPETGVKIPLEIIRRRMTSPETADVLIDICKRHQPHLVYVENNAYQDSLLQWIRESSNISTNFNVGTGRDLSTLNDSASVRANGDLPIPNNSMTNNSKNYTLKSHNRMIPIPVEGFMTGKQKFDEFIGLPSMAAEFANKGWAIFMHRNPLSESGTACQCSYCVFIDELANFPIGKHDDTIMAAWFAREAARKVQRGGFELW